MAKMAFGFGLALAGVLLAGSLRRRPPRTRTVRPASSPPSAGRSITIHPRHQLSPNATRHCTAWLAKEYRPSGTGDHAADALLVGRLSRPGGRFRFRKLFRRLFVIAGDGLGGSGGTIMSKLTEVFAGVALAAGLALALPGAAQAQHHHHGGGHYGGIMAAGTAAAGARASRSVSACGYYGGPYYGAATTRRRPAAAGCASRYWRYGRWHWRRAWRCW